MKRIHDIISSSIWRCISENLKNGRGLKLPGSSKLVWLSGLEQAPAAYYFVEEIGRRIKEEGLQITAVTTLV